MNNHRRYEQGLYPFYDQYFTYDAQLRPLLIEDPFKHSLLKLEAFKKEKEAQLFEAEEDLNLTLLAWKKASRNLKRKGDNNWDVEPDSVAQKRWQKEARVDVINWELDVINTTIKEYQHEKETNQDKPDPMPNGPLGHSKISGLNGCGHIDFNIVKFSKSADMPIIVDDRSPYNGMSVADYKKHIVMPYLGAKRRAKEKAKEAAEKGDKVALNVKVDYPKVPKDVKLYKVDDNAFKRKKKQKV
jgi:hypothetical protein